MSVRNMLNTIKICKGCRIKHQQRRPFICQQKSEMLWWTKKKFKYHVLCNINWAISTNIDKELPTSILFFFFQSDHLLILLSLLKISDLRVNALQRVTLFDWSIWSAGVNGIILTEVYALLNQPGLKIIVPVKNEKPVWASPFPKDFLTVL